MRKIINKIIYSLNNKRFFGFCIFIISLISLTSVVFYDNLDPSLNLFSRYLPNNALGYFGSNLADIFLQLFGFFTTLFIIFSSLVLSIFLILGKEIKFLKTKVFLFLLSIFMLSSMLLELNQYSAAGKITQKYLNKFHPYYQFLFFVLFTFNIFFIFNLKKLIKNEKGNLGLYTEKKTNFATKSFATKSFKKDFEISNTD